MPLFALHGRYLVEAYELAKTTIYPMCRHNQQKEALELQHCNSI